MDRVDVVLKRMEALESSVGAMATMMSGELRTDADVAAFCNGLVAFLQPSGPTSSIGDAARLRLVLPFLVGDGPLGGRECVQKMVMYAFSEEAVCAVSKAVAVLACSKPQLFATAAIAVDIGTLMRKALTAQSVIAVLKMLAHLDKFFTGRTEHQVLFNTEVTIAALPLLVSRANTEESIDCLLSTCQSFLSGFNYQAEQPWLSSLCAALAALTPQMDATVDRHVTGVARTFRNLLLKQPREPPRMRRPQTIGTDKASDSASVRALHALSTLASRCSPECLTHVAAALDAIHVAWLAEEVQPVFVRDVMMVLMRRASGEEAVELCSSLLLKFSQYVASADWQTLDFWDALFVLASKAVSKGSAASVSVVMDSFRRSFLNDDSKGHRLITSSTVFHDALLLFASRFEERIDLVRIGNLLLTLSPSSNSSRLEHESQLQAYVNLAAQLKHCAVGVPTLIANGMGQLVSEVPAEDRDRLFANDGVDIAVKGLVATGELAALKLLQLMLSCVPSAASRFSTADARDVLAALPPKLSAVKPNGAGVILVDILVRLTADEVNRSLFATREIAAGLPGLRCLHPDLERRIDEVLKQLHHPATVQFDTDGRVNIPNTSQLLPAVSTVALMTKVSGDHQNLVHVQLDALKELFGSDGGFLNGAARICSVDMSALELWRRVGDDFLRDCRSLTGLEL